MLKRIFFFSVLFYLAGCKQPNAPSTMPHEARMSEVQQRVLKIKPGISRAEVQHLFPQIDGGITASGVTRFYEHPEVKIEVPFDETGGKGSGQNKVTGQARVYREPMAID